MKIKLISISWAPRWDKNDKLFYVGRSWEASVWTLDKSKRIELYSTRVQLGPIRIKFGFLDNQEFEELT